ncbi:MAG: prepilin-type N-terminal cleavage/methylation domain-containing protein [Candidatus Taylorbacteria bacterium]|nr:prepilin-type N-terminal cleavage/methylation domain-containing protein [Candidatus Taylorbacteria bacterium]
MKKGFTLIELLVVISIISLLSSVVLSNVNSAREKGRLGAGKYFAAQVYHVAGEQSIALLDLNECAGSAPSNKAANGIAFSFSGTPIWQADTPYSSGCSLSFNATNYVVASAATTEAAGNNPFAVSFWTKRSSAQSRASMMSSANYTVGGWMVAEGYASADGRLFFERNVSGGADIAVAPNPIPNDKWVHVVAVYDNSKITIYQDGVAVASVASTGSSGTAFPLRLASTQQGGWGGYSGSIDEVQVFSKGLTASEVGKIYALGRRGDVFAKFGQ